MFSKLQFEEFFVFLKASIDNSKNFSHENVFIEAAEKKKIEETEKHFNLAFNYRQAKPNSLLGRFLRTTPDPLMPQIENNFPCFYSVFAMTKCGSKHGKVRLSVSTSSVVSCSIKDISLQLFMLNRDLCAARTTFWALDAFSVSQKHFSHPESRRLATKKIRQQIWLANLHVALSSNRWKFRFEMAHKSIINLLSMWNIWRQICNMRCRLNKRLWSLFSQKTRLTFEHILLSLGWEKMRMSSYRVLLFPYDDRM